MTTEKQSIKSEQEPPKHAIIKALLGGRFPPMSAGLGNLREVPECRGSDHQASPFISRDQSISLHFASQEKSLFATKKLLFALNKL